MNRRELLKTVAAVSALCLTPRLAGAALPGESLDDFNARMQWWRDARFGMFIHWGIYAELALGEWAMNNLKIPEKAYQRLAPRFNPTSYDPDQWVSLAKTAGMKYMVLTSKHHDGFCMFDSKHTDYNVVDATPYKRDAFKMLADACGRQEMTFGFYYSILDSHQSGRSSFREMKHPNFDQYVNYMNAQLTELLTNYGPIGSLFFDGEWTSQWTKPMGVELEKHCRGLHPSLIINDRVGKRPSAMGDYETPEQFIPAEPPPRDWETCETIAMSWGYHFADRGWKSSTRLIHNLIDIVAKGGNYLLNVGPTGAGLIPQACVERLEAMGAWMDVNGEAIHGSRSWDAWREGESVRFTRSKDGKRVYALCMDWPGSAFRSSLIKPAAGSKVTMLGSDRPLSWRDEGGAVVVEIPEDLQRNRPCAHAWVFRFEVKA